MTVTPEFSESQQNYFLRPEALTRFINNAEWNLAPAVSPFPSINFVLYIPSASIRPLHIYTSNALILPTNAFLVPRWGGVLISNPEVESQQHLTVSDLQPAMEVFIAQLRTLIGVKPLQELVQESRSKVHFASSPHSGITLWELDALVRKNTYHNLVKSATTLRSLATMVEEITNMVIEDKIQEQVLASLKDLGMTRQLISSGDYLGAVSCSKEALRLAERSFFDPHMLAMLYFPDDHKYAIYVPLYLPVSMPLVFAIINEVKRWRAKKEK